MKLVLFDIDGTIVNIRRGAASESGRLIKKHFGVEAGRGLINSNGMTDRQILVEKLKAVGIKNPESDPRFSVALDDFVNVTKEFISEYGIERVQNVENLIKKFLEENIVIGVLTGNTQKRAYVKLGEVKLGHYFKIGAFGHTTTVRMELVGMALKDAKEKLGLTFKKKDVFILGDTIRDVQCAKDAGVKSIAVATGIEDIKVLKNANPDFAFKDFSDVESIVNAVKG